MADLDAEKDAKLLDVLNPFSADHKEKKVWADKFRQNVIAFMKAESSEEASTAVVDDSPSLRSIILEEENKLNHPLGNTLFFWNVWFFLHTIQCQKKTVRKKPSRACQWGMILGKRLLETLLLGLG